MCDCVAATEEVIGFVSCIDVTGNYSSIVSSVAV